MRVRVPPLALFFINLHKIVDQNNKKLLFLIFFFYLLIFLFTAEGHVESIDAQLRFEMTKSMVDKRSLEVDYFLARKGKDGRYYNTYGPITSLLAVPFYLIAKAVYNLTNLEKKGVEEFMFSMMTPILGAITVLIFFLFCLKVMRFNYKKSFIASILFSFFTPFWFYTKYSANEVPCALFSLIGFYFLLKTEKNSKDLFLSGLGFGLAYLTRWEFAILFPPIFIWVIYRYFPQVKPILLFSSGIFPIFLLGIFYSYTIFGSPFFSYGEPKGFEEYIPRSLNLSWFFSYFFSFPPLKGFYRRLFSFEQGIFTYSPFIFFFINGFYQLLKKERSIFFLFLFVIFVWVIFYTFIGPKGVEMGPRYHIPILFIFVSCSLYPLKNYFLKLFFYFFVFISFIINFLGINVSSHRTHLKLELIYRKNPPSGWVIQEERLFNMISGCFEVWRNYIKKSSKDYFFSREDASVEERLEKQATIALPNFWWIFLPFFGVPKFIILLSISIFLILIFYSGLKIRSFLFYLDKFYNMKI
ncbi:MAG: glycosyltransferase family 39 protein [candidate division WOR-3 bacterium]